MTISPELEAQILRYYHVEKWRAGTIARQQGALEPGFHALLDHAALKFGKCTCHLE